VDTDQPIKRAIDRIRFQVAIDRPMKDHVTSLHLTTEVFKISFNNASALFSLTKERFEDEQDWGP
tara:strand:- start:107 stop:301 length:195 start_codon:yes stop_codon:yes gene_type:complete